MTEPKKKLSWTLSILFHTILALVVIRAGYKMAFPEANVESVSFEVAQQAAAPAVAPEPQAPSAPVEVEKNSPKEISEPAPPKQKPQEKIVKPVFIPAPPQNDIQPADTDEESPMVIPPQPEPEPEQVQQPEPQAEPQAEQLQPEEPKQIEEAQQEEEPPGIPAAEEIQKAQQNAAPSAEAAKPAEEVGPAKPAFGAPGSIIDETKLTERPGNRKPSYPWSSRLKRQQGTVIIKAFVRPDGSVESVSLYKSSGFAALDNEALEAYAKWRYTPGAKGWVLKPFKFSLVGGN